MKQLPVLLSKSSLKGKRVLLRVDWNIPLSEMPQQGDLLKIQRSAETIKWLQKQGAVTVVLTHLGRPKGRDPKLSTARLLPFGEGFIGGPIMFCGEDILDEEGRLATEQSISAGKPGSVFLMENVRYYDGEEKDDKALAKVYASFADLFVNDAFASCHRKHVSVHGIAKLLPHYAGPQLVAEVEAALKIISKPKKPFVAIVGGAKLSTKMPVISALLKKADYVLIGGAMAHSFLKARKLEIGKSFMEAGSEKIAKPLLKNKKLVLPADVIVAKSIKPGVRPSCVAADQVKKTDRIGDIGVETMRAWAGLIKDAQTILWNGPLGVFEVSSFSHGSLVIGRAIASRSKGKAYGIVGGGDTIPVVLATGMEEWFDHISTGGGALLEFIAKNGKLPGVEALYSRQSTVGSRKLVKSAKKSMKAKAVRQIKPANNTKSVKKATKMVKKSKAKAKKKSKGKK